MTEENPGRAGLTSRHVQFIAIGGAIGSGRALVTMCVGVGQGVSLLLDRGIKG